MAQHNTNLTHLVWGKKCFLTINLDKSFADVPFISRRRWSVMSCACLRQCVHICEKCVILTSQRLCVVSPPETLEYEWVQICPGSSQYGGQTSFTTSINPKMCGEDTVSLFVYVCALTRQKLWVCSLPQHGNSCVCKLENGHNGEC